MKTNLDSAGSLFKQLLMPLLGITCCLILHGANAETLIDPTQPPASQYNLNNGEGQDATGPVLQSVMIGSHYRAAIISGQKVMLGGKYEDATLIRLNEHEAVLRNADKSTQTLAMNSIEKKIVRPVTQSPVKKRKRSPQAK